MVSGDVCSAAWRRDDASRRLRLIADAYGLTEPQHLDIIPLLAWRTLHRTSQPAG